VISTQSPPHRPFSVVPYPKLSLSLVNSSANCRHKLIVASDGWRGARERSACCMPPIAIASSSSIRPRHHLIVVVPSSSSSSTMSMLTSLSSLSLSLSLSSPPPCSTSPSSLSPSPTSLSLASLSSLLPSSSTSSLVVVVLVVCLGCQSKEFDQSKPRRYHPWLGGGAPSLGFAVGWPTALLGQHLVKDVVLSEISWC
jgi:hypothetical protein